MSANNMDRLIEKWTPILARCIAEGDHAQAHNWQEAIEAAKEIIARNKNTRLGRPRLRDC